MRAFVITRLTFLEAVRRRIAIAAIVLGVLFLIIYATGLHFIHKDALAQKGIQNSILFRNQLFNFLSMAGLYATNFLTIAMGVLISADTLAGEISSGTVQTIASKPLRRMEIVLGKWLGFAALIAVYLLFMAGGVLAIVYFTTGYHVRNIAAGLSLIYLASILLMTVSLACSSMFSTLATGGVVFGLYGIGFIGGWVEQVGTVLKNQTAVQMGVLSSLMIPSEAIWKRAAYEMTSTLMKSIKLVGSPFTALSVPNPLMMMYAGIYIVVMLLLAVRQFGRRDL